MKSIKVLLSLLMVLAILLATSLPALAIDFVAEDIYESVFVVYSGNSLGSGFAIGENCIVTNAHVIENPEKVVVKTYSGKQLSAYVVGINQDQDIAVLGVKGIELTYLTIADFSSVKTGDDIYAIGAPKSMAYTLTKGVVSAQNREVMGNTYIQIDAAINEGNSGGPLLNESGQVLGINTLKISDSEGIGLAIPTETLKKYLISLDIKITENGNVIGSLEAPAFYDEVPSEEPNTKSNDKNSKDDNKREEKQMSALLILVSIIAVLSIICNVVLLSALVHRNKKDKSLAFDPRERTDFDIEILG